MVYNEEEELMQNEVLRRSEKLQGYGLLLRYIRNSIAAGEELKDAIDLAVNRCLQEGILADFLKAHSAEVGTMLYDDITREEFLEIRAEEAREEGFAKGLAEGRAKGLELGIEQGLEQGIAVLIEDNLDEGKSKGEIIEKLQKRFGLDNGNAKKYFAKYRRVSDDSLRRE